MALMLDAETIQDETEIGAEADATTETATEPATEAGGGAVRRRDEAGGNAVRRRSEEPLPNGVRVVTLPTPEGCMVWALLQAAGDGGWLAGFQIRLHNGDLLVCLPGTDKSNAGSHQILGLAVKSAIEAAQEWIEEWGDEESETVQAAMDALDDWMSETDSDSITGSIFDKTELGKAAREGQANQKPATSNQQSAAAPRVTDDAQAAYDTRTANLESEIARLTIEQAHLKAAIKGNRKCLDDTAEELEKHLLQGPERLPLFDRAAECAEQAEANKEKAGDAAALPAELPEAAAKLGATSMIRVRFTQDITLGKQTIAATGETWAGYVDADGDTFVLPPLEDDDDDQEEVYLEAEEFEVMDESSITHDCPKGGRCEPDEEGDCSKCGEPGVGPVADKSATDAGEPDAWRRKLLADLDGLTPKIVEVLEGHDIRTLGDWVDAPTRLGCEYTQLRGITEKRFEKIQDAMTAAIS